MTVSYEEVLEHLLQAHGEHLRTTTDPLSLGDFVTVNYVNPLYVRAKSRPEGAMGRLERFVASGGDTEVLLEGLPESTPNGYDPSWVEAINTVMVEREVSARLTDVNDSFWEAFIGPMCDAVENGWFPDLTTEVEDESRGHH